MNITSTTAVKLTSLVALQQAAECLKTLAYPHRMRMVQLLLQRQLSVGELAQVCDLPSHMASDHLRLMERCGFLESQKEGRCKYYRVSEPHLKNIMSCIEDRFGTESVSSLSDLSQ